VLSGERPSVLERQALEAQAALETANQLRGDVAVVEAKVLGAERQLEAVREAILTGSAYRGKERAALAAEEERLVVKERLLREKEVQLREERLVFLRKSQNVRPGYVSQRRGSDGEKGGGSCCIFGCARRLHEEEARSLQSGDAMDGCERSEVA